MAQISHSGIAEIKVRYIAFLRCLSMARNGDTIIRVEDLHKRYEASGPEAVAGIDFEIRRGEIFGLLGPNGAGKTTTIGAITTRVRPTGGRVIVDGIDVASDPVSVKLRIAVVPQMSNLDRSLSAIENLTFHAAYFGAGRRERRERARELLDLLGLGGRENDRVNNYSGGMAQRLMIARALMHEPHVLILDEPTTGLDPQSRLFLWDKMLELRERGTTLMLTTHDMIEADRLCDRIAIIDHGKVIALDTPRGLRRLLPAEHGLELTIDGALDPAAALAGLGERVETRSDGDGRWTVRLYGNGDGDRALAGQVVAAVERSDGDLVDLRRIEGSLEDVFVHLTGRELR
jgi:ABC-2 type transport system ATP-binding protein